jgi:hypothetical protein
MTGPKRTVLGAGPTLLAALFWLSAVDAWAQEVFPSPASPEQDPFGTAPSEPALVEQAASPERGPADSLDRLSDGPAAPPGGIDGTPHRPPRFLEQARFDYTWLPGGGRGGFGTHDFELSGTVPVVLYSGWAQLRLTPGVAVHEWQGPESAPGLGRADLPAHVFDATLDLGWRPHPARWLFLDLGITPGIYGDLAESNASLFRLRGRALGIVALSPEWQFVGGVLYVNRNHTKVLPAGGIIWNPSADTRCELLFPQPKVSRWLATFGGFQWWGYVAGEFGGGSWAIERARGVPDSVDYNDVRLLLGLEWIGPHDMRGRVEAGYVFDRELRFVSPTPDLRVEDTFLLRVGLTY